MEQKSINFSQLCILVADGSPHMRDVITSMLREFGASNIIPAEDGDTALEATREHPLDVILVDAHLPKVDGLQLTRKIRTEFEEKKRTLPILIMMSDPKPATVIQARDCGANMVLAKPLSPATLYDHFSWLASAERSFVSSNSYFGPDRRVRSGQAPSGRERRSLEISDDAESPAAPRPSDDEIEMVLNQAKINDHEETPTV